ncbi:MAG: DUF58 domain-containing protein [Acidobacteria bacterium]|nr:DUF58 domain-containing protein [Acidobacteriota bacterium]
MCPVSLSPDIYRKIRQIEIATRRLVDEAVAGEYHSVFKGRGIEYSEVRPYQAGDDIRTIDWNVTSRSGSLHVKKYVEERELTVLLLVDASRSTGFGSGTKSKEEVAAEIAAIIAFSAIRNNDRVGVVLFTGAVEKYIPPRKGTRHVLRLVREILAFQPARPDTSIGNALEFASRVLKKRSIVFLISDFFDAGYADALRVAARMHDLVGIAITDTGERSLPPLGWLRLADLESGQLRLVPAFWPPTRRRYQEAMDAHRRERQALLRKQRVDQVEILADASYEKPLQQFFRRRARRLRR